MREFVATKQIRVEYIRTDDNAADMLTKALPKEVFERHLKTLAGAP